MHINTCDILKSINLNIIKQKRMNFFMNVLLFILLANASSSSSLVENGEEEKKTSDFENDKPANHRQKMLSLSRKLDETQELKSKNTEGNIIY